MNHPSLLFDVMIIENLEFSKKACGHYNPQITPGAPGQGLRMRPLCKTDYDKGYTKLLSQLTKVGDISKEEFENRYSLLETCPNTYYIIVVEDVAANTIVATGTLVKERKFIHQCSNVGHIDDVVVHETYRGKQLGKLLLDVLCMIGEEVGCYKLTLDCTDKIIPFYNRFKFKVEHDSNFMVRRYWD